MENNPENSIVMSLGKVFNETPHLYVEDRWPRHFGNGNSQASADWPSKIWRYNSLSREWTINMENTPPGHISSAHRTGKDGYRVGMNVAPHQEKKNEETSYIFINIRLLS